MIKKTKVEPNNQLLWLSLAAFMFAVLALLAGKLPQSASRQPQTQNTEVKEERIEISGVKMANFLKDVPENATSSSTTLTKTKDYHIFFISKDELFVISITSYPFDNFRVLAEQEFLKKLAISQEETCKLNVDITTPMFANPDKAGKIYELSWCEKNF